VPVPRGLWDETGLIDGWWDQTAKAEGWFDADLLDASASADVTVALTGVAGTGAAGTVGIIVGGDITVALTGTGATGQVGSVGTTGGTSTVTEAVGGGGRGKRRERITLVYKGQEVVAESIEEAESWAAAIREHERAKLEAIKPVPQRPVLPVPTVQKLQLASAEYNSPAIAAIVAQIQQQMRDDYRAAIKRAEDARAAYGAYVMALEQDDEDILILL